MDRPPRQSIGDYGRGEKRDKSARFSAFRRWPSRRARLWRRTGWPHRNRPTCPWTAFQAHIARQAFPAMRNAGRGFRRLAGCTSTPRLECRSFADTICLSFGKFNPRFYKLFLLDKHLTAHVNSTSTRGLRNPTHRIIPQVQRTNTQISQPCRIKMAMDVVKRS